MYLQTVKSASAGNTAKREKEKTEEILERVHVLYLVLLT